MLYPFAWHHVFIPILPKSILSFLCAPMPYLMGCLSASLPDIMKEQIDDEIVILDVDKDVFIQTPGATGQMPTHLTLSLQKHFNRIKSSALRGQQLDHVVASCFLRFFSEVMCDYEKYLDDEANFNYQRFYKSKTSEIVKFLELFKGTQAFSYFFQERESWHKRNVLTRNCVLTRLSPAELRERIVIGEPRTGGVMSKLFGKSKAICHQLTPVAWRMTTPEQSTRISAEEKSSEEKQTEEEPEKEKSSEEPHDTAPIPKEDAEHKEKAPMKPARPRATTVRPTIPPKPKMAKTDSVHILQLKFSSNRHVALPLRVTSQHYPSHGLLEDLEPLYKGAEHFTHIICTSDKHHIPVYIPMIACRIPELAVYITDHNEMQDGIQQTYFPISETVVSMLLKYVFRAKLSLDALRPGDYGPFLVFLHDKTTKALNDIKEWCVNEIYKLLTPLNVDLIKEACEDAKTVSPMNPYLQRVIEICHMYNHNNAKIQSEFVLELIAAHTRISQHKYMPALQADMNALYASGDHADAQLVIGFDLFKVPVHTALLGYRSSVFKQLFSTPHEEYVLDQEYIAQLPSQFIVPVIRFLYSGLIEATSIDQVITFLAIAQHLGCLTLEYRAVLVSSLAKTYTPTTVVAQYKAAKVTTLEIKSKIMCDAICEYVCNNLAFLTKEHPSVLSSFSPKLLSQIYATLKTP